MGYTIALLVTMTMNGAPVPPAEIVTDTADGIAAGVAWPFLDPSFGTPLTPDDAMCHAYEAQWRQRAMDTLEKGGPSSATYSFRCKVYRRM